MDKPKMSANGQAFQLVWAGDLGALRQLIKQVETLADYIREKLERRAADAYANEDPLDGDDIDAGTRARLLERSRKRSAEERAAIARLTRVQLDVETNRWSMKLSGDPEVVLADIENVGDVRKVTMGLPYDYYGDRHGYDVGVDLTSTGARATFKAPEPEFIDLAGTRLKQQLRASRPWYWWFRAPWAPGIYAIPAWVAGYLFASWLLSLKADLWAVVLLQVLFGAAVIWGIWWTALRIARPFELVPDGAEGRARKNLGRIASVGVWVVTAILIPILLTLFVHAPTQ